MPYLTTNHCRLYYEIEGKGDPLVLVAGYGCDLSIWAAVREELTQYFQLILFDNRAVGRSECPERPFTLDDMATDTVELIRALRLQRPHILGHSMGGAIVQIIAHQHPEMVSKTIIAQSMLKLAPVTKAILAAQLHLYQDGISLRRIAENALPWLFSEASMENAAFCESFLQEEDVNPIVPQALSKQFDAFLQFDSTAWYKEISTAPLILSSDEDRLCGSKDSELMAAHIPHAKHHMFHGAGHASPVERPEAFCSVVRSFLNQ